MMGRLKHEQEQLFYEFQLDEVVPHDHLVRDITAVLDLSWVHAELLPYYSPLGRSILAGYILPEDGATLNLTGEMPSSSFALEAMQKNGSSGPRLIK